MLEILYESKNAVVALKPAGMPSQADESADADMLSSLKRQLSLGDASLFLVHRLDRAVGGALVFARNKRSAAALSAAFSDGAVRRVYFAVVEGVAEPCAELTDYLVKNSALGKAFISSKKGYGAKVARLSYKRIATCEAESGELSLVAVSLETGRFHQIRAQLSSRGLPIVGDGKYGAHDRKSRIALFCSSLAFFDGEREISVAAQPDTDIYPWSLFSQEIKELSSSFLPESGNAD